MFEVKEKPRLVERAFLLACVHSEKDREEAAHLGVNEYVVKAAHFREFAASVREFTQRYIGSELNQ